MKSRRRKGGPRRQPRSPSQHLDRLTRWKARAIAQIRSDHGNHAALSVRLVRVEKRLGIVKALIFRVEEFGEETIWHAPRIGRPYSR